MTAQTLTTWLKLGYLHLKAVCGLPDWVLPEYGLNRTADEVGDEGILRISRPLELAKPTGLSAETISPECWRKSIMGWPQLTEVKPIVAAFFEVSDIISNKLPAIRMKFDPSEICRSLAVLLFAPFVDQGKPLLVEVAAKLGINNHRPCQLLRTYAGFVVNEDVDQLRMVSDCIAEYPLWSEWAVALEAEVNRCRYKPKLIAVTPPASNELSGILALLAKEACHGPQ